MNDNEYLTKLDTDHIHVTTRPYLNKVMAHTEPYEVSVCGESITVLPSVMSPKYDWAGLYMIEYLPKDFSRQDVLELGPGCGLVSVFVGLRGATSITAADINPAAVENTNLNFKKFKIPNAKTVVSDVFSNVPKKKYDSIIFNLPYHDGLPANDLEKGVKDAGYEVMETFFAEAASFLKQDGKMYIGFSRSGNLEKFHEALKKNSVRIDDMEEKNMWNNPDYSGKDFHYNCQVYTCSFETP
ncbi:MAG: N-methyl-transferase [Parcubacteria group bacterium]|nr:N-methyl-transferase [Parcubacteria group bacterium]